MRGRVGGLGLGARRAVRRPRSIRISTDLPQLGSSLVPFGKQIVVLLLQVQDGVLYGLNIRLADVRIGPSPLIRRGVQSVLQGRDLTRVRVHLALDAIVLRLKIISRTGADPAWRVVLPTA